MKIHCWLVMEAIHAECRGTDETWPRVHSHMFYKAFEVPTVFPGMEIRTGRSHMGCDTAIRLPKIITLNATTGEYECFIEQSSTDPIEDRAVHQFNHYETPESMEEWEEDFHGDGWTDLGPFHEHLIGQYPGGVTLDQELGL